MAIRVNGARVHGRGPVRNRRIVEKPSNNGLKVDKFSVATAERVFTGLEVDLWTQTPTVDSPHPNFPGLRVVGKSVTPARNGRAEATVFYQGPDPALGASGLETESEQEELAPAVTVISTEESEAPIETHPNFDGLVAAAGTGEGQATFNENGLFEGFGPNSGGGLAGVQTYTRGITTTTVTVLKRNPLDAGIVGKLQGGGLVIRADSESFGSAWKTTQVTKTGVTWNPLIYPNA